MLDSVTPVISSIDLITIMWNSYTVFILALGIPMIYCPNRLPRIVQNMYNYGKLNDASVALGKEPWFIRLLRLDKSTFTHFYAFGAVYELLVIGVICWSYFNRQSPVFVVTMLDTIVGQNRAGVVEPVAVMVVAVLLLCQSVRRWYECGWVSVYSDGKLLFTHYVVGLTFYWGASTSLIAWAPGFTKDDSFDNFRWQWHQLFGTVLYFWVALHQYNCTLIFANLRKDSTGKVLTKQHKLPRGDWFEYVSCPHLLAEVLIYVALNLILSFRNPLFITLLVFVVANQTVVALLTQQWYLKTFKNYPKHRKAILPFLL